MKALQELALRQVFLQLVRPGTGTGDTRRRALLDHFKGAEQPAIQQLAKERLLVTGRDVASGKETVEIAHEALIQHWARLRQWLDADREFLTWRERLGAALGEWERTARKDAGTLLRGAPLAEAEHWLSERVDDLTEDERTYIQASVRARRRRRLLVRTGITFALLASVAGGVWQYLEAERLRQERAPIPPDMVVIAPGHFMMGSSAGDPEAYEDEFPAHEVAIEQAFRIGRSEVTFAEYDRFALATGRRPPSDQGWGGGQRPVINVSWEDAVAYAQWLSKRTGKPYRLPTEAEWEYAARAGSSTKRFWGDDASQACEYANVYDQTGERVGKVKYGVDWEAHSCDDGFIETAPVGQFETNAFGLHDMLGNVWEWVQDCWHEDYEGAPDDGSAWQEASCRYRVVRGGSWFPYPRLVRSASRLWYDPASRGNGIGFRLAQSARAAKWPCPEPVRSRTYRVRCAGVHESVSRPRKEGEAE